MKGLVAIVAGAALAGTLGVTAVGALGGSQHRTAAAAPARLTPEAIYKRDAPGVVVVSATQTEKIPATFFTPATTREIQVGGSGFVIDGKGDIVTNEHVVQDATGVKVGFSGGATYPAMVVGSDPSTDIAVIRVDTSASALHPLAFADSGAVQVGDPVYAIGNPFGLDRTMTAGIVSAVGRDIQAPNGLGIPNAIQTDAPINHGNSGGPLLDRTGRVVGVNDQIESGGAVDGNVGVGFAIAGNTARTIAQQLIDQGHVAHAWLGIEVAPIDPAVAGVVRGMPQQGLLVVRVVAGGPAARAGLRAGTRTITLNGESMPVGGDTILALNGKRLLTSAQLADAVRLHKPGDELSLSVVRAGHDRTVHVRLGNAPGVS